MRVFICDRCGHQEYSSSGKAPEGWSERTYDSGATYRDYCSWRCETQAAGGHFFAKLANYTRFGRNRDQH